MKKNIFQIFTQLTSPTFFLLNLTYQNHIPSIFSSLLYQKAPGPTPHTRTSRTVTSYQAQVITLSPKKYNVSTCERQRPT